MQNIQINNSAALIGIISSDFIFSHEVYGEKFYSFFLSVPRLSGVLDNINIIISEHLIKERRFKPGDGVSINGQFRSYNNYSDTGNKLILSVFVKNINHVDINKNDRESFVNEVKLIGYLCKQPTYRTTPFGREITDLLIAVNRTYNKSDYIPCIAWGRNAKYSSYLNVGDKVNISGRIQSREYQKKISEDEVEAKTAYEVSISKISFENPA